MESVSEAAVDSILQEIPECLVDANYYYKNFKLAARYGRIFRPDYCLRLHCTVLADTPRGLHVLSVIIL